MTEIIPQLRDAALASAIKSKARELGFDHAGIASADPSHFAAYVRRWIADGKHGEMAYLAKRLEERINPQQYFPEARSVICVAMNYYAPLAPVPEEERNRHGRIARYALGRDYHEHIKSRLHQLADWIRQQAPDAQTRAAVDTAPVLEREMAARSGIGWIAKNTCVINRHSGSFLLLGQVITSLELQPDEPETDHCGTCTRCIDACPTAAITAPYQLDARRCISYLTIEHRGDIAPELQDQIGDWLFGCDICQDVCPHNRAPPTSTDSALQPRWPTGTMDVQAASNWTEAEYQEATRHSAMRRVKLPMLRRNAQIVLQNLGKLQTEDPR
jgi:epoxyqueuosine reductase